MLITHNTKILEYRQSEGSGVTIRESQSITFLCKSRRSLEQLAQWSGSLTM